MQTPARSVRTVITRDELETRALGAALASVAIAGDVLCLSGELGAGKTQLAKGFGAGLGVEDAIQSPSFILMAEHRGRLPMFHIDLYRLGDPAEAIEDGLLDDRESAGVTLVEWAERLGDARPASRLDVRIDVLPDESRLVALSPADARHARYLAVVR
ncbi:MAG TPA: tRNA (adenosine(37)-N6)-threonylcarbamoyltransferase complex ATPase subunit type 1 TsaE [Candidatus Dormibacteraeota bacterium]|nr:tRNA (adenosine(37)-N6)-threonylcarbamoyltransferase complex ATPase subunit type 1 TsaE [Candidatus Dormibacteraeota bacterium]